MNRLPLILGFLCAALVVGVLFLSRFLGMHWNLLLIIGMLALPLRFLGLGLDIRKKQIRWPKDWNTHEKRTHIPHGVLQSLGPLVGALAVSFALIPTQLGGDLLSVQLTIVGLMLAWVALAWLPRSSPRRGLSIAMAAIIVIFGKDLASSLGGATSDMPPLLSPFEEEAVVMHGGSSPLINHHALIQQQHNALDLVVLKNDAFTDGPLEELDSYGCWGVPVRAPARGTVVTAVGSLEDQPIGQMDTDNLAGNHVVIEIGPEQYAMFAHLQAGSVTVQPGDTVEAGATIGRCGNSGNTSLPHLHFQVMNRPDFSNGDAALITLPVAFAQVRRSGTAHPGLVPRRNDVILP